MNLSFQFNPGMTLSGLTTGPGPYVTSYAGSLAVTAVPEPATFVLVGLGGFSVLLLRGRKQLASI
jgi:hypothetical protein